MTRLFWTTRSHTFAGCIQSGTGFPDGWGFGKCVPEFAFGVGCSFPTEPQAETASHSRQEFWDTVSGCKKGHKTWPSTYICSADTPMTSRAPTTGRLSGRRHIRFIASSARAGEHLMCSPCEQDCPSREPYIPRRRADEPVKTRRYLILVVPGARLGSVSLASVWKCSVYTFLPSRNIS